MSRLIPTPSFPGAERRRAPLARRLAGGWALGMALALMGATALHSPQAWAQAAPSPAAAPAPDAFILELSTEVLNTVKSDRAIQAGDTARVMALVDSKVMPHVNFQRMTASAVGRHWRSATPEQQ
ncbi:MAG: phospholipid-binding protein MlaC, partial [Betaproteobacteria bacterium]